MTATSPAQYRCDKCALTGDLGEIARCVECDGNDFDRFTTPADLEERIARLERAVFPGEFNS